MAITIPQNDRFKTYTAAGGQTTFAYDFPIYEDSDLGVYQITAGSITLLVLTTDYTVTGAGLQAGGNVVLVTGATLNDNIIISGDLPELRSTNYSGAGDFQKTSINTAFNKLVQLDQQLRRDVDRSIHLDPADMTDVSSVTFKLPLTDDRKGKFLYFDETTGAVAVSEAVGADISATYITQTPSVSLPNEQAMSALTTGIVKNATTTGVQSIAVDGTDYISPTLASNVDVNGNSIVSLAGGDITLAPDGTGDTVITSPIVLSSQAAPGHEDGKMYYDSTDKALSFYNDEVDAKLSIGQSNWIRVYNDSGSTINTGSICYASGKENVEDRLTIALAQSNDPVTARVIGAAVHDIENSTFGFVTQFGYVNDVDTSAFSDGASMWLSSTAAGGYTDVEPLSPNVSVFIGFVVDSAVSGSGFMTAVGNTSGSGSSGDATQLVVHARKGSPGTISQGKVVYISGYNNGSGFVEVEEASASSSATMPAIGIVQSEITNTSEGEVVMTGRIAGINTSSLTAGQDVYVSTTPGFLSTTKPTGTALVQKLGITNRSHASLGVITVTGAGRSNDIPNFTAADKYWYGGATGTSAEGTITAFGRSLIDDAAASNARTTLGLVIGTDVQAFNTDLTSYDMGFVAGYTVLMTAEDLAVQTYGEIIIPRSFSITGHAGYLETQATGTDVIINVEKNGVSVYTVKPGFIVSTSTITPGTLKTDGTEDFVSGDRLTFKVTQIGSTIAGARMRFTVKGEV